MPFAVDQDRDRQAHHAHLAGEALFEVGVDGHLFKADFAQELFDGGGGIAPCGDGDHREILGRKGLTQSRDRGHFLAARGAPCRPEVHQKHLTFEIGQGDLALGAGKGQGADRQRLCMNRKFRHIALAQLSKRRARNRHVCNEGKRRIKNR